MSLGVKHLQLKLDDPTYWVVKYISARENMSLKEFIEEAVVDRCLSKLHVGSIKEATDFINSQ